MTFEEMFERAKTALTKAKVSDTAAVAVQINVTGDGSGTFYVKAADGVLAVEPYDYKDHDVLLTADSAVLLELLEKAKTDVLPLEGTPEKTAVISEILATIPAKRATRTRKTTTATTAKTTAAKTTKSAAAKTTKSAAEKTASTKTSAAKKTAASKTTAAKTTAAAKTETKKK